MNKLLLSLPFLLLPVLINAQKLPDKQEGSLRAPDAVKIDGNLTEWGSQFKAFNHATDIFYTLADAHENLYLIIQATDPNIISRIIRGGVTFSVSASGSHNDKGMPSVTFPVIPRSAGSAIAYKMAEQPDAKNPADRSRQTDSLTEVLNKLYQDNSKYISLSNIKQVPDSLISVYNYYQIKAAGRFNNKKVFTCEVMVPITYLGLKAGSPVSFAYHVRLNGYSLVMDSHAVDHHNGDGVVRVSTVERSPFGSARPENDSAVATDFWGEYVLVK